MPSTPIKTYFTFTTAQRSGVLLLLSLMLFIQLIYYFVDFSVADKASAVKQNWLSLQTEIDSLKQEQFNYVPKIYPFNPNFITDFKGYKLGMSVAEIDRLLAFRATNKYVNSAQEFQNVTKVSDSLLQVIAPYFKFPDWVNKKNKSNDVAYENRYNHEKPKVILKDINLATQEDLIKIYGIGPALSERILKEKDKLGGFVAMEQMQFIWGLSPEVIENINKYFRIITVPTVPKLKINSASIKELMQFPYFKYALAKEIVTYRSMNGQLKNAEDLLKINGFPVDKIKIIALYLEF